MDEIVQIISTVGFPITAVIGMSIFFYRVWMIQEQRNKEREESLMNIIREYSITLGQIVDENTKMIAVLSEKIENVEQKLGG